MVRRALALLGAVMWSSLAVSAEVTHVATAATALWPVEIDASVGFRGTLEQANIAKEEFQTNVQTGSGTLIHGTEMSYRRSTTTLPLRVAGGIWHNLELHVLVPIIIEDSQHWEYSNVSNGGTLDTINKPAGICPEGASGSCANGISASSAQNTLLPTGLPLDSNRGGFEVGNITLGAAWAPLSEADDPSLPTWLLGFDYIAPNASVMDPTRASYGNGGTTVGDVGDGLHHFHPYTALSKRTGAFDPYVSVWLDFAHANGSTYNNCDHPFPNSGGDPRPNCGVGAYTSDVTRLQPEYQGAFWFGTELVPFENAEKFQKISLDVRAIAEYHSQARTYTQVSDLLQALTAQQDYARFGGEVGLYFHASKYFRATLNFSLAHDTDHWLTEENLGPPNSSSGQAIAVGSQAQNPNFDFRYDNPGSRFLLQGSIVGSLAVNLMASF